MNKKTEYIYNKNGNKPFTESDKKRLLKDENNFKYIYDDTTQKQIKLIKKTNLLIDIKELPKDIQSRFKRRFNNADYISINDVITEINNITTAINELNIQIEDTSQHKTKKNIIPNEHTFNLVAPKIFTTTYKLNKYTYLFYVS